MLERIKNYMNLPAEKAQMSVHADTSLSKDVTMPISTASLPKLPQHGRAIQRKWRRIASEAAELINSNGMVHNGVQLSCTYMNGPRGLKPNLSPTIGDETGFDEESAAAFKDEVEEKFCLWADNKTEVDISGRYTLGELAYSGAISYFSTGDAIWTIPHIQRDGSTTKTKVDVVDPVRLKTPHNRGHDRNHEGVEIDQFGSPIAYWFDQPHFNEQGSLVDYRPVRFQTRTKNGRLNIVHTHDARAGALRGLSPLTSGLKAAANYTDLQDSVLEAQHIENSLLYSVETDLPPIEVENAMRGERSPEAQALEERLGQTIDYISNAAIDPSAGPRVVVLPHGSKMSVPASRTPNSRYQAFSEGQLREIARAMGLTYEQLTGDGKQASYSWGRQALEESWSIVEQRRRVILEPFYIAVLNAWLEEQITTRRIEIPNGPASFIKNRQAFTRCQWVGWVKPTLDPAKAAQADKIALELGTTSLNQISMERTGLGYQTLVDQRVKEQEYIESKGMTNNGELQG